MDIFTNIRNESYADNMLETKVNFVNRPVILRKKLGENMCWVEHNGDLSVG